MARLITNQSQFNQLVLSRLKLAVEYILQRIYTENEALINELVYNAYSPVQYDRTGEFGKAWSTETETGGNLVMGEFKYDPEKMSVDYESGQHSSVWYQADAREYLADIIFNGMAGAIYEPGYAKSSSRFAGQAWTQERNASAKLDEWLTNRKFRKIFEEGMTRAGIPWHRNVGAVYVVREK